MHLSRGRRALLLLALTAVLFILTRSPCVHAAEPVFTLSAYHIHRHSDATTSAAAAPAATLLSDFDLLSEGCALDTVVVAAASAKRRGAAAGSAQSITLEPHHFTLDDTAATTAAAAHTLPLLSPFMEGDTGMPESPASAEVRRRDAEPTQLRALGLLRLGTFQAETVATGNAAMATLEDVEGENETHTLPATLDPGDEAEHSFELHVFLGDFTRVLCLSAALYRTQEEVGNLSAALVAWVPHSVSPSCAMRLGPQLRRAAGLSLTEEAVLWEWQAAAAAERRCRLSEGHHFTFAFTPAPAQAKKPAFCAYEKAEGAAAASTPGTRRLVSCQLFLEVQALTWYREAVSTLNGTAEAAVKVAAAVTAVGTGPRSNAAVSAARAAPQARFPTSPVQEEPASRLDVSALGSPALRQVTGDISRYKGTLWCTTAAVGSGFWFSNATSCVTVVQGMVKAEAVSKSQRLLMLRDGCILAVLALGVAGFVGVWTARVVRTVRSSRLRRFMGR